jgi:hypothetical protein
MQMLFGNMNVSGADAAFQVFPKVFQAVHMRTVQDIFLLIVVNYLMVIALLSQAVVADKFIRVRRGTLLDILLNDWMKGLNFAIRHNLRHYLSVTLKHSEHNGFIFRTATAPHAVRLSSDIGFINLNIAKQRKLAINIFHMLANQVRHSPSRLIGYAKLTLQFFRRNAMAGSGEQINGIEPQLQRCAAILERRADRWMQMMPAPLASIGTFGLKAIPLGCLVALWADMALPEANVEQVFKALLIFRKAGQKLADCWAVLHSFLIRFHMPKRTITAYLCQGDNSVFFSKNCLMGLNTA